ncbi:CRISPR-associated protein Cas5 [Porphyromonas macacae]|uniref:CRISPR-associated protein Cas5 n=1 Tax=Porphyromonas macacae TaxID=28115 RepID=A0A0A2EBF7_9PORP|nr:CRISPR-associated endoribonuclease Cas6 [Porphyromonas macacae]KGN74962.1 CRISPR-associated protein Cas5 [Porphyromonas macacae]SUB89144.1 Uncharacterized protein predicted to be involved in DNA repair (RAMP superfamily) [Porphyromonas macacae]
MRLQLIIRSKNVVIPFNHQPNLVGTIHKWIGENDLHGKTSSFSFSRLNGGCKVDNPLGIYFERSTDMFISAYNPAIIANILNGIRRDPTMFNGLIVNDVIIVEDPDLSKQELFYPASPLLLKKWNENGNYDHIVYSDDEANILLTKNFQNKLDKAGLHDETAVASFIPEAGLPKVRLIDYKGVKNKTSWCPIRITGRPESKLFAWNAGLGNSTGIGFGAIK